MSLPNKVSDQVGYLLLHENGALISSSGDLENDEKTGEIIYNLISLTNKLDNSAFPEEGFNKISICFNDFCYVICMSNKKIHIVKRTMPTKINSANIDSETELMDLQAPVINSVNE